jgi:hypothetical protein
LKINIAKLLMSKSEGVSNPVDSKIGLIALRQVDAELSNSKYISKEVLRDAVKYSLQVIHKKIPGKSVELRIPPISAISIIQGKDHKRGTPPALIEIEPETWLKLALGKLDWKEASQQGLILASGANTDLSQFLPIQHDLSNEN